MMSHPSFHARNTPDKPAYIMADSGEVVTYGQLEARSNQAAQLFRAKGLRPGDHIAVFMANDSRFMEVIWGAQRSGLVFTTISTHLTANELAYILNDCGAKALVASAKLMETAIEACQKAPGVKSRLCVGDSCIVFESYCALCAEQSSQPIADECVGVEMLYSSGTTGRPKGIAIEFESRGIASIPTALLGLIKKFEITQDSVYLSPAPLYHAAPLRFTMLTQFQGGTAIIMEKFDAAEALRLIAQYRVTLAQFVPVMLSRLLALPAAVRHAADTSSLQIVVHAAAPCPIHVKELMIDWWGPILHEYYGSTEAIGITVIDTPQWLAHKGSVGRAIVGRPRIVDDASGRELPVGEIGVVYFSDGPGFRYHNDPQKTAEAKNEMGWYSCGDIGYVDADGYLYLTDRKAFTIISGGVNVYPAESEEVLSRHPQVADVAVIGVASDEFGEEVKAVVELKDFSRASPELAAELIAFCRQKISVIKCPRSVDFIEKLPRLDNGKLYKQAVKNRYQ